MEDKGSGGTEFLGQFQHTLDPKGRLILPAAFRDALQEGLVMTVGLDNCLTVHPLQAWRQVLDGLRQLRSTDQRQRMFARMITSSAHPETPDKQGRITIPPHLREYADLRKDVAVVGGFQVVEIWDSQRWTEYRNRGMADFARTDRPFETGGIF